MVFQVCFTQSDEVKFRVFKKLNFDDNNCAHTKLHEQLQDYRYKTDPVVQTEVDLTQVSQVCYKDEGGDSTVKGNCVLEHKPGNRPVNSTVLPKVKVKLDTGDISLLPCVVKASNRKRGRGEGMVIMGPNKAMFVGNVCVK